MEQWKVIPGYEGYEVSNYGNVRSVDRIYSYKNHKGTIVKRNKKGTVIKTKDNGRGYLNIHLGRKRRDYVHRLVASTFIPNPENKPSVNHINGNTSDNRVSNLEWATYSENQTHSKASGLAKTGPFHPQSKLSFSDVRYIIENYIPRHPEYSGRALAKKFGVGAPTIHKLLKRHGSL